MDIDSDFDRFCVALAAEAEVRGKKPLSEAALMVWWHRMSSHTFEDFERALGAHAKDPEQGRFFPQPADLVRHLEGTTSERAALAWAKALDAASRVGAYTDVVFDDPAIHAAISDLGGWPKLCRTEDKDMSFLRHRFGEAYRAHVKAGEQLEYPARLHGDNGSHELYTRRGLPPPQPVLIGDKAKAAEVLRLGGTARAAAPVLAGPLLKVVGQ